MKFSLLTTCCCIWASFVSGFELDITDEDSIKSGAKTCAQGLLSYYNGNQPGGTPGLLPQPYYWWECGSMFGGLVDYWYLTGDDTWNDLVTQGLLFQIGSTNDYMPNNQTLTEGNDDQGFWGFTVMAAAERKFPNPPADQPQWLELAQAVFNSMVVRWDTTLCSGGLRWQIFAFNKGWDYKNSIANGCLFHMAARLARYTGNTTYSDWAEKIWDWEVSIGFLQTDPTYAFWDGANVADHCNSIDHIQWSYNPSVWLAGAAYMYNFTNGAPEWQNRTQGILDGMSVFFAAPNNIMYEAACEPSNRCDTDQLSFKAYLSRFMTYASQVAPFITDTVEEHLKVSAPAAAASCSGGADGVTCGMSWLTGKWDGSYGVGQQMSAMETIQNLLIFNNATTYQKPLTNSTGGNSTGNSLAGTGGDKSPIAPEVRPTTTGDRVGAGFLTAVIIVGSLGGCYYMAF